MKMSRRERRAAKAEMRKIERMNLDELFEDTKQRVRETFTRYGGVSGMFLCVTEDEDVFVFEMPWHNREEQAAAFAQLRDAFRARGVVRYAFASEIWMSKPGPETPSEDPEREEGVEVIAI